MRMHSVRLSVLLAFMVSRAVDLSPIVLMLSGLGPMKLMP